MTGQTIFCQWENEPFPASAFKPDDEGRMVHLDTTPLHTRDGMPIDPPDIITPPAAPVLDV